MDVTPAERLLEKLRRFIAEHLDDDERVLIGQLLVPGIAHAYQEEEVEGFTATGWSPGALPESLVMALRDRGVRVVGLDP